MSAGEKRTFALKLGFQLLILVGELPMLREKLLVQQGPSGAAILRKGNISIVYEDSCQVIYTPPSNNYSTRISGTGYRSYLFYEDSRRAIFTRPSDNYSTRISGTGDDIHLLGEV